MVLIFIYCEQGVKDIYRKRRILVKEERNILSLYRVLDNGAVNALFVGWFVTEPRFAAFVVFCHPLKGHSYKPLSLFAITTMNPYLI